jgi:hypothetical protein
LYSRSILLETFNWVPGHINWLIYFSTSTYNDSGTNGISVLEHGAAFELLPFLIAQKPCVWITTGNNASRTDVAELSIFKSSSESALRDQKEAMLLYRVHRLT